MPSYISLIHYTPQGIASIKQAGARVDAARQAFKSMGAEIKAYYLVTGQYDAVVIFEAPDEETVAKLALGTALQGNVRTETMRAFTEQEMRAIIGALP